LKYAYCENLSSNFIWLKIIESDDAFSPVQTVAVSIWFKPISVSYNVDLVEYDDGTQGSVFNISSSLPYWTINLGDYTYEDNTQLTSDWHHLVTMIDTEGDGYTYLDNVQKNHSPSGYIAPSGYNQLSLGKSNLDNSNVYIDEFGFWKDHSLSNQTEVERFVASLYYNGAGVTYDDM
jgi:hypothetical protein